MATVNTTPKLNSTVSAWPYEPIDPKQGIILLLITIPGVLGNIIAFAATVKLLKTRVIAANYLVLALTVTDFYGIFFCTMPTLLCYIYNDWVGGGAMCKYQGFSAMFASLASGCLATVMAIDRMLAITKPFKYRKLVNPQRAILSAIVIWISAVVISLVPIGGVGRYKRNLTGTFCTIDWFAETASNVAFAIFYAVLGIFLMIVLIYCNIQVIVGLRRIEKKRKTELTSGPLARNHLTDGKRNSASDKLERQFARAVCVISLLFLICWLPFMVRVLCNLAGWWKDPWADVQVSRLLLLNFVLDPFLYSFSRKQCRDILFGWFCCCLGNKALIRMFSSKQKESTTSGRYQQSSEQSSKLHSSTAESAISVENVKNSRL